MKHLHVNGSLNDSLLLVLYILLTQPWCSSSKSSQTGAHGIDKINFALNTIISRGGNEKIDNVEYSARCTD